MEQNTTAQGNAGTQSVKAVSLEPERSGDSLPNGSPEGVSEATGDTIYGIPKPSYLSAIPH